MIKLYLKSRKGEFNGEAMFDTSTKGITVLNGSVISTAVSGGLFRSAKSVEKRRQDAILIDNVLGEDLWFKSASAAANFITGRSTNGLIAWKTEDGETLKAYLDKTN